MKKLINFFCLIGIIFFFPTNSYSQQSDVLIRLSPTISDKLNLIERNYYSLYTKIEGFENAVFYSRDNKFLVTKIKYKNNLGENKDTVFVENKSFLGNLRANIRRTDVDRNENMENSQLMTLTTKTGENFTGKLLDVKLNQLFMADDLEDMDNFHLLNNYRVFNKNNIESVFIKGKDSKALTGLGLGFLFGALGGASLVSIGVVLFEKVLTGHNDYRAGSLIVISGITLGVVGGVIGLINGINAGSSDELLVIKTDADYNRLKGYLISSNPQ